MKLGKLLLGGALGAAFSASAMAADITIRITGSTAFRSATLTGIRNYYSSAPDLKTAANNATFNSAGAASFLGTVEGKSVLIQCSFSGSVVGLTKVAGPDGSNQVANFITEAFVNTDAVGGGHVVSPTDVAANFEAAAADVAMADNTQAQSGLTGAGYSALQEEIVGVIPFVWVKGRSADANIQAELDKVTNITGLQARALFSGAGTLSLLVPQASAFGEDVVASVVGRDSGSGTRLNVVMEAGLRRNATIAQSSYGTIASGTIPSITENHAGYGSGSSVVNAMNATVAASVTNTAIFGYMGIADAAGVNTQDASSGAFSAQEGRTLQVLSYNGVPYSHEAVRNGSYALWNYELMSFKKSLNADKKAIVLVIKDRIRDVDVVVGGIQLSTMKVTRNGPAQVISLQ